MIPDTVTARSNAPEPAAGTPAVCVGRSGLDAVYLAHAPLLRKIAAGRFGVPVEHVDALVHDVFATYLGNADAVRGDVRRYLVGGICNAARGFWRSRAADRRVFCDEECSEATVVGPFENLEGLQLVAMTLARLSARCREALERYYLHEDDTPTIACALGTTSSNVNYLMHVCRKRARAIYEELSRP